MITSVMSKSNDCSASRSSVRECRWRRRHRRHRIGWRIELRQQGPHRGASTHGTLDGHAPAGLHNDAVGDGEPEARPAAATFRGEERLEDASDDVRGDADPGVPRRETHVAPRRQVDPGIVAERDARDGQREAPALRHGVTCVAGEIEQDLLETPGIDADGPHAVRKRVLHVDGLAKQSIHQPPYTPQNLVRIQQPRLAHLPTAEYQNLAREIGGPTPRGECRLDLLACRMRLRQVLQRQFGVSQDRREVIVEVMRDTSGERTQRFQLLGLAQSVLGGGQRRIPLDDGIGHAVERTREIPHLVGRRHCRAPGHVALGDGPGIGGERFDGGEQAGGHPIGEQDDRESGEETDGEVLRELPARRREDGIDGQPDIHAPGRGGGLRRAEQAARGVDRADDDGVVAGGLVQPLLS